MDFGASYGGYSADLTRTVPVNGKFTSRQKEVYNACLDLHRFAKELLKPGMYPECLSRKKWVSGPVRFLWVSGC
jgi:Xaa-Pro aminopeptidase